MSIKSVRISKLGRDHSISPHFKLGEFASKDGADIVRYSTELLDKLEELRSYGGFTITINSGYRTVAHNKAVGGTSSSCHVNGTAADIVVCRDGEAVNAKLICCLCQSLGFPGVAYISKTAVHVDVRENGCYRGDERKGYGGNVGGDFYRYFKISKNDVKSLKVKQEFHEESEEKEMSYKDITEVPEWGREAVQLRIDHNWSDGKNLPESLVRAWVSYDRENPYISDMDDLKKYAGWAISEVQDLIDRGKLKGNKVEPIGKRLNVLMAVIIASRHEIVEGE